MPYTERTDYFWTSHLFAIYFYSWHGFCDSCSIGFGLRDTRSVQFCMFHHIREYLLSISRLLLITSVEVRLVAYCRFYDVCCKAFIAFISYFEYFPFYWLKEPRQFQLQNPMEYALRSCLPNTCKCIFSANILQVKRIAYSVNTEAIYVRILQLAIGEIDWQYCLPQYSFMVRTNSRLSWGRGDSSVVLASIYPR